MNNENLFKCPLCLSTTSVNLTDIKTDDIIKLYLRSPGIDINYLFNGIKEIYLNRCTICNLDYFTPLITGDEMFYSKIEKNRHWGNLNKFEFDYTENIVNESDKVLEIGAGAGVFSKKIKIVNYTGLEFNDRAIDKAGALGVKLVKETIEVHASKEQNISKYDIVCAFQVLEHVRNPRTFLLSALKCLKEEGFLIVAVPNNNSFINCAVNNKLNLPPHHVTRWDKKTFEHIPQIFNCQLVDIKNELMSDIHKNWYLKILLQNILRGKLNIDFKIVDLRLLSKVINRISGFIASGNAYYLPKKLFPKGHTMIVKFKKGKFRSDE